MEGAKNNLDTYVTCIRHIKLSFVTYRTSRVHNNVRLSCTHKKPAASMDI
jgi:hypothetical protein